MSSTEVFRRFTWVKLPNRSEIKWVLIVLGAVVFPPLLARIAPSIFTEFRFQMLTAAAVSVMAALALNILMGYAGQISLGHGAFVGVGAFATGYLTWWWGFPFITGLVASALLGGLFALLVGLPALRIRGLYLAVATLAFGLLMEHLVFNQPALTGGQAGTTVPRPLMGTFEFNRNADFFVLCFLALAAVWLFDRGLVRTKIGRAFFAIREDEDVASSYGVDVAKYKLLAFVVAGVIASISGSFFGALNSIAQVDQFTFENMSLGFIAILVIGGLGSRPGVAVAAAFFAVFRRLLPGLEEWVPLIGALLLIYTIARHPGGFAQAFKEARESKDVRRVRQTDEVDDLPAALPSLPAISGQARSMTEGDLLKASGVSVRFGGLAALTNVSLEVPRGKIVGLIGPNGAGKTTMFNVLSGFIRPASGRVEFLGTDVTAMPAHSRAAIGLGRTFQLIGLGKNMTVKENFLLAQHHLARYGIPKALFGFPSVKASERELQSRADEAISALGFERFADAPVRQLSHGQQRLVELGCALVTSPELLLLDEPSGGMAPAAAESLAERLLEVRHRLGRTVLLIEHHIPLVLAVCDEIYVLNYGEILAHGTKEEITRNPEVIAAYFGEEVA